MTFITQSGNEESYIFDEFPASERSSKYASAERLFRLIQFLTANDCTRDDIFTHLR